MLKALLIDAGRMFTQLYASEVTRPAWSIFHVTMATVDSKITKRFKSYTKEEPNNHIRAKKCCHGSSEFQDNVFLIHQNDTP